jgi:hypothetical protein
MGNAGLRSEPNLIVPPGLQDEDVWMADEGCLFRTWQGFQVLMFATIARSNRESPLDRQITTPENQASAEFNSINPLEQGLDGQFFFFLILGLMEAKYWLVVHTGS